MKMTMTNLERK